MGAHPLPGARSLEVLAVENRRLAGERLFQAATPLVCRHALEHLVGRAADELGGAAPRVRFVGRVHVAVAPVAPEHARRQAERFQARHKRRDAKVELGFGGLGLGNSHGER